MFVFAPIAIKQLIIKSHFNVREHLNAKPHGLAPLAEIQSVRIKKSSSVYGPVVLAVVGDGIDSAYACHCLYRYDFYGTPHQPSSFKEICIRL